MWFQKSRTGLKPHGTGGWPPCKLAKLPPQAPSESRAERSTNPAAPCAVSSRVGWTDARFCRHQNYDPAALLHPNLIVCSGHASSTSGQRQSRWQKQLSSTTKSPTTHPLVQLLLSVLLTQLDTQLSCHASHKTGDYFLTGTIPLDSNVKRRLTLYRAPPMASNVRSFLYQALSWYAKAAVELTDHSNCQRTLTS